MRQIVECVPNFSEGRRPDVIDAIVRAISGTGVHVLDVHSDVDHNRTVVTFVGEVGTVEEAAFAGAAVATRLIDMETHTGVHPRMGATDVIPLIPLRGITMAECVAAARRLGERLADELELPVYTYAEAAARPDRRSLAAIRRGGYEELLEVIDADDNAPDFGPRALGSAGAVAVGARGPLVAFNIYLDTADGEVAEAVARAVRESSGGLRNVQARGFLLESRGLAQVSMNLLDVAATPLLRVFDLVVREATARGAGVTTSELVGLLPEAAAFDAAAASLRIGGFGPHRVLESRLAEAEAASHASPVPAPLAYVEAVASDAPTPGGGSVAGLVGAIGAALTAMVAGLTIGKPKYAAVEDDMKRLRARAYELQRELLQLMERDEVAFRAVMDAYRLPRDAAGNGDLRREAVQASLAEATEVPLETMRAAVETLRLARTAAELGNTNAISDAGVAARMAHAAAHGASFNVAINVRSMRDLGEGDRYRRAAAEILKEADAMVGEVDRIVRGRIAG
jgi:glutamate formiminotransferase / formiminotetrahydrofolate cyclodeaminase